MRDHSQQAPAEQFVLVEDAALALNLKAKVLRQGIACGLVPIRRDNTGTIRVHLDEIPDGLEAKVQVADINIELQAAALTDEVASLEKRVAESDAQRTRLEELLKKQGSTLARHAVLLDAKQADVEAPSEALASARKSLSERDAEILKLTNLLDRSFRAIDARDKQVAEHTVQLTAATDKAMSLLSRTLQKAEVSTELCQVLNEQISASAKTHDRLEQELVQRNAFIDDQQGLVERMVTMAEQTASGPSTTTRRKLTFWQRLWGGGKGI